MAKPLLRHQAIELRRRGIGVRAIARTLGIAQSTASVWTRGAAARETVPEGVVAPRESPRLVVWRSGRARRCPRCAGVLPEELFGRTAQGRQGWCRPCFRAHARARGQAHRDQVRTSVLRRRATARAWVIDHLRRHPCTDCGSRDLMTLEFDHLGTKLADVATLVSQGRKLQRVIDEVAGCEVVCANCHRRRTASRAGWLRTDPAWRLVLGARATPRARNQLVVYDYLEKHPCVDCGESDIVVLDFDHVADKRGAVSTLAARGCSLSTLDAEIAKCEVRCANCHRRVTSVRAGYFRACLDEVGDAPADDPQLRLAEARRLRTAGHTITEIANATGAVQKTVSVWVRDLPLTEEQQIAALSRARSARIAADDSPDAELPRRCSRCGLEQPTAAFSRNGTRRRAVCKACTAEGNSQRTPEQRARAAAAARERRRRAREQVDPAA